MTGSTGKEDGYLSLAYTEGQYQYPSQPGTFTTDGLSEVNCPSNHYCEGGTNSARVCPSGYANTAATSGIENFSAAACTPFDAGTQESAGDSSVSEACPPGNYCPQGTANGEELQCHPGTLLKDTSPRDR